MEKAGVLEVIGHVLAKPLEWGETAAMITILWASAIASAVTDNIPLAAMLAKIFKGMPAVQQGGADSPLWWSIILGANLGGNISPIGSASTVVAVTIMAKENIKLTFIQFVSIGGIFAVGQLALASVYLWIIF